MMRRAVIGVLVLVVVGVLFVVLCTFQARPYEKVVLDRFGNIVKNPTRIAYNWFLCLPTDKVVRLDNRLHLHETNLQQVAMRGGDTLSVRVFAAWRIVNADQFYRSFKGSDEAAQTRISTEIAGKVQSAMGKYALEDLFNTDPSHIKTQDIENSVQSLVSASMKDQGVEVAQVGFSRMAFPPGVVEEVYRRMSAEREQKAARFRTEGETQAAQILASAQTEAAEIRAEAQRRAAAIRAGADEKALTTLREEAQKHYDFYRFWRELELLKASMDKNTYLLLNANEPIMDQLLKSKSAAPQTPAAPPAKASGN